MVIYKNGNILKAPENIICHQVNVDGTMVGGITYKIGKEYPEVQVKYNQLCRSFEYSYEKLRGLYQFVRVSKTQQICNCFTQKPNGETSLGAIKKCFKDIFYIAKKSKLSVAIPFNYGCSLNNDYWEEIITIIRTLSGLYDIEVSVYIQEE